MNTAKKLINEHNIKRATVFNRFLRKVRRISVSHHHDDYSWVCTYTLDDGSKIFVDAFSRAWSSDQQFK